jgi:hypothetical protein
LIKVYCKRTLFIHDEKIAAFSKGEIYETLDPEEYESKSGIFIWIMSNQYEDHVPMTKKNFLKYFTTIDDMRNTKINKILKND